MHACIVNYRSRVSRVSRVRQVGSALPSPYASLFRTAKACWVTLFELKNRELKIETFSGRRRPDWQRKPGTEAAVASRQKSNIKIAVNSEGRRR